jgi:seryl-tRNA(Sec) selenium transferase
MSGTDIHSLEDLEKALRLAEFPLIGRITQDRLWLSVRTLLAGDEEKIAEDFKTIGLSL